MSDKFVTKVYKKIYEGGKVVRLEEVKFKKPIKVNDFIIGKSKGLPYTVSNAKTGEVRQQIDNFEYRATDMDRNRNKDSNGNFVYTGRLKLYKNGKFAQSTSIFTTAKDLKDLKMKLRKKYNLN